LNFVNPNLFAGNISYWEKEGYSLRLLAACRWLKPQFFFYPQGAKRRSSNAMLLKQSAPQGPQEHSFNLSPQSFLFILEAQRAAPQAPRSLSVALIYAMLLYLMPDADS
jgi:hypothetical protein